MPDPASSRYAIHRYSYIAVAHGKFYLVADELPALHRYAGQEMASALSPRSAPGPCCAAFAAPASNALPASTASCGSRCCPTARTRALAARACSPNIARALAARGHAVTILSGPPYPEVPEGVDLAKLAFARPVRAAACSAAMRCARATSSRGQTRPNISATSAASSWSRGASDAAPRNGWPAHADRFDVVLDNQCLADPA
jgi:hypothetical protein